MAAMLPPARHRPSWGATDPPVPSRTLPGLTSPTAAVPPVAATPRWSARQAWRQRPIVTPGRVGVALVIVAGIAMRVFVLSHALGSLDADEATTGLVARHFLHNGEHPVFYWSSNYGGTLEAAVTATAFALFGSTVTVLKVVAICWYAGACVLAWRVGARLIDEPTGLVAGLLLWVWPATYLWWSTKSRGFYGSVLVFGLVMALTALRAVDDPRRRLDWFVFGLAFGLGWWGSTQIVFLAVPVGLWVLLRNWRALRWSWLAVPGAVIGAAPWLLWNLRHPLESFHTPPQPVTASVIETFRLFWRTGLPVALGLRVPYTLRWIVGSQRGPWLYLLVALALVAVLAWRWRVGVLLGASVIAYSLLYALNPLAPGSADGRYVFMLSPVIAFAIALVARRRITAIAVLSAATVLSGLGLSAMHLGNSFFASDRPVPISVQPLVRMLDQEGVRDAFADYAIAERVDFETGERITVVGAPYNRYPPYDVKVRANPHPAWIFLTGSDVDRRFRAKLDADGEPYRVREAGGFTLYLPEHKLLPGQVPSF